MGKDKDKDKNKNKNEEHHDGAKPKRDRPKSKSESEPDPDSDSDTDEEYTRKRIKTKKAKTRSSHSKRRHSRDRDSYSSSSDYDEDSYDSDSESGSGYSEVSDSEEERRRRRKERKRREEKREKRRREKEKDKRRKRKEEDRKRRKKKEKRKDKDKDKSKVGAVTNSWGKYGIIRETDMWNKRPEFTAWLAEVKKVNLESLANWEEKQLFKDFMEDHNTATFPSKKYYNLDAYYQRKMEKEQKKGIAKVMASERTVFNDEEQRRIELLQEREKIKEQQVTELKRSMQGGMAQAMKEQAQLREEMAYQYKLGNFEAAAAIQRRLDPDVAM